jgi:transposase
MEVLHPRCAGLDVHKDTVVAAVRLIEGDGSVRREVETFVTTTPGLLALSDWLERHDCPSIAMEATGIYWRPVWQVLAAEQPGEGRTLILANAAHVKNVPGRKTDVADAVWLSDLLAHGLIRPSFVPDAGTRAMRDLLRTQLRSSCASRPPTSSASRRRSRTPTSSSPPCSPTSWASRAALSSPRSPPARPIRSG